MVPGFGLNALDPKPPKPCGFWGVTVFEPPMKLIRHLPKGLSGVCIFVWVRGWFSMPQVLFSARNRDDDDKH